MHGDNACEDDASVPKEARCRDLFPCLSSRYAMAHITEERCGKKSSKLVHIRYLTELVKQEVERMEGVAEGPAPLSSISPMTYINETPKGILRTGYRRRKKKGERRKEKEERRKKKGERRKEKEERRKKKGEGRKKKEGL
jgi:hypothetical protein